MNNTNILPLPETYPMTQLEEPALEISVHTSFKFRNIVVKSSVYELSPGQQACDFRV